MENKTDKQGNTGGRVAIIGAIITAIAGIITTIVSISGPIVDKRLAIQTTQTREAFLIEATRVAGVAIQKVDTPTPMVPTVEVVEPAQTQQPTQAEQPALPPDPTATPAPVNAQAQPDPTSTPSETMLKVGESWVVGNGLTVTLTDIQFPAGNQVKIHFTFENTSKKTMNISVNHTKDVTLTDDKGNVYKWSMDFTWEITSYPGTTRGDTIVKSGDVSRASYFIVKLDLPGIGSMKWRN